MIERLNSILTDKTISVEVKCVIDEAVIDRNFQTIVQCLRDLGGKHAEMEKNINELVKRNQRVEKQLESVKTSSSISGPLSEELIKVQRQQDRSGSDAQHSNDKQAEQRSRKQSQQTNDKQNYFTDENGLRELVRKLQDQMSKQSESNKKNNLQNIKDINVILRDLRELKERVEKLENAQRQSQPNTQPNPSDSGQSNLENIRVLQNQLHKQSQKIDKLHSDMDRLKNKNNSVLQKLRAFEGNPTTVTDTQTGITQDLGDNKTDSIRKDLQRLSSKVAENESRQRQDVRNLTIRLENIDVTISGLKDLENRVSASEEDIEQLKQRLDILSLNTNNVNFDSNTQKERLRLEKQLRRLEESHKKDSSKNDEWRRRMEESVKEHTLNISDLQNQLSQIEAILSGLKRDNNKINTSMKELDDIKKVGSKLPSLGEKKNLRLKSISRQDSAQRSPSDLDKKLQELRSEIQQWVKQLLDSRGLVNQDTSKKKDELIDGLQLKIQQLKILVEKKADNEGVKKYLSFLDNKINQIWSMLSQPDTEDALIARKGWNCLSCAKNLQKYRGQLGNHVNWNNLTTMNYSPPRVGYTQSVTQNSTQNITIAGKARLYGNQQETNSKELI